MEINVPDVESFPVIRVAWLPRLDPGTLPGAKLIVNRAGDLYVQFGVDPQETCKNMDKVDFREVLSFGAEVPNCTPESNTLAYPQAYAIAKQAPLDTVGLDLDKQTAITDNQVMSRVYKYKYVDGQRIWLDPVNETGYYYLHGKRVFHGITAECCNNYLHTPSRFRRASSPLPSQAPTATASPLPLYWKQRSSMRMSLSHPLIRQRRR